MLPAPRPILTGDYRALNRPKTPENRGIWVPPYWLQRKIELERQFSKTLELPPDAPLVGGTPELNPPFQGRTLISLINHIESYGTKVDRVDIIKQNFFKNIKINYVLNLGSDIHVNIFLIPKLTVENTMGYFYLVFAYSAYNLDIYTQYSPAPYGTILTYNTEETVISLLVNLLLTRPGERLLAPTYGCRILDFLYELPTETTALRIKDEINRAVSRWMPEVIIKGIDVVPEGADINITIFFEITQKPRVVNLLVFRLLSGGKIEFAEVGRSLIG